MPRHRNVRSGALDEDLDAAKGEFDDDYLDEYDDDERRIDPEDGRPYCKRDFVLQYGGTKEWDAAPVEGAVKEEQVSRKFGIPRADQDLLRQHKGSVIEDIMDQFGVTIVFTPKTSGGNLVTVSGGESAVPKIEQELKKLVVAAKKEADRLDGLKKEMQNMNSKAVLEKWPTLDTQKPTTVNYDIDKSVHHVIEGKIAEINKRFNYGKNEVASYDPATKQLIGDTFLTIPAKFDPSTILTISGPSHKVKAAVTTLDGFLTHFKLMGNVNKVTHVEDTPAAKPAAKKAGAKAAAKKPKKDAESTAKHEPKGVATAPPAAQPSEPSGRGAGVEAAGRGQPADAAGRGTGVGEGAAGRGAGIEAAAGRGTAPPSSAAAAAGRGAGVAEAAGRGAGIAPADAAGRGQGVQPGRGQQVEPPTPPAGRGTAAVEAQPTPTPTPEAAPAPVPPTPAATASKPEEVPAPAAEPTPAPPAAGGRGAAVGAAPAAAAGRGRGGGVDLSKPNAGRGVGRGAPTPAPEPGQHVVHEQRERSRRH